MKIFLAFTLMGIIFTLMLTQQFIMVLSALIDKHDLQEVDPSLQFRFQTENGQERFESVHYSNNAAKNDVTINNEDYDSNNYNNNNKNDTNRSLEFRGDYSFVSADGYRYTVKYKANKKGYLPYVTVEKVS